jgi:uncharacterized protein YqkB
MILTDLFFDGKLELKWNPEEHSLMLKPEAVINVRAQKISKHKSNRSCRHL